MIVSDNRVAKFVSERLGFTLCPPWTCLGIERDGVITGGVIFHCFEGHGVHVTVAGSGWTKAFMKAVGEYVYAQLGCLRMTITTESQVVAGIAEKCGGVREGVLRSHFGPDRHAIIIGILRDEYRY